MQWPFEWFFPSRKTPTVDDVRQLLEMLERILEKREWPPSAVESAKSELQAIKGKIPFDKDGNLDAAQWEEKNEAERNEVRTLLTLMLKRITRTELFVGRACLTITCLLIASFVGVYLSLHQYFPSTSTTIATGAMEISSSLRTIETEIEKLQSTAKAEARDFTALTSAVRALQDRLRTVNTSFQTRRLLEEIHSDASRKTVTQGATFKEFSETLLSDLEPKTYFWSGPDSRWVEFAFWAEFGVLVGIIFFIARQLGAREFAVENLPMFVAEVVIAPPVVLVIFFLFDFSGITDFTPTETSIVGNLGLAFILGFAIRRTMGLLDSIKSRILPAPAKAQPDSKSET